MSFAAMPAFSSAENTPFIAAAWAAIAFTLNYIPFIGPLVATLLPEVCRAGPGALDSAYRFLEFVDS